MLLPLLAALSFAGQLGPWPDDGPDTADTAEPLADAAPPACASTLRGGVQLPDRPELFLRWDPARAWGSPYLIDTIVYAAERMAEEMPDADPIVVGDISTRWGGRLGSHKSHQSGQDADIGFYMGDRTQPGASGFLQATPQTMDLESTWLLVRTLLETGRIEFILLDQSLITALKSWTIKNGELSAEEAERIFPAPGTATWGMHGYVRHVPLHKDHLHVRVLCTP